MDYQQQKTPWNLVMYAVPQAPISQGQNQNFRGCEA